MKLFSITYNIEGFIKAFDIVSDNVDSAINKSNDLCALVVGDRWKQDVKQGKYMVSIMIKNVIMD